MDESKKTLAQEREELELEQLRDQVHKLRAQKESRQAILKENEQAFKSQAEAERELQRRCNHKKGGRDFASLQKRGDGENHSILAQQQAQGYMLYICSHCLMVWLPGCTEKKKHDGTENPTGISYEQASRLPTDNSPAGSVVFGPRMVA